MIRISKKEEQEFEREHAAAIREVAAECTLFLKRDGNFPVLSPGKLALYGNGARHTIKGGTGSGDVNVRHFVTAEEGLKKAGFQITTDEWLDGYDSVLGTVRKKFADGVKEEAKKAGVPATIFGMGRVCREPEYDLPLQGDGDTAIYVLARNSGEGSDRKVETGDILLTETEKRDILALNEAYEKFVLVLNTGGLVDLEPVAGVKNILLLGQLGTPTGEVLADILTGKMYPSGKLTMTWADMKDYPSTGGFGDINDTEYKEDIFVGYRHFELEKKKPFFPFGFGLSYTDFAVKPDSCVLTGDVVILKAEVENTGSYKGKEVVQVYVSHPEGAGNRPVKELKGFSKTKELLPGEKVFVTVEIPVDSLKIFDPDQKEEYLPKGDYGVFCGSSSADVKEAGTVNIAEEKRYRHTGGGSLEYPDSFAVSGEQLDLWKLSGISDDIRKKAEGLSGEDLVYLCIGQYPDDESQTSIIGAAASKVAGAAGETTGRLEGKGIPSAVMADGPAGIRISKSYLLTGKGAKPTGIPFGEDMLQFMEEEEIAGMLAAGEEEKDGTEYYQYCTAIPIGTGLAQTWNPEAVKACGDVVGDEMEQFGIDLWLAPALNIMRSPLCGRNFEYYSEDPFLSGKIAAAMTIGVQEHPGCGVTIKHFAANNQETNRYASNSIVSERALREIYLKGFEICIKEAAPAAVMTSYNLINGEHACNRRDLLTDILRGEWKYQGVVMTDWYVTTDFMKLPGSKYPCASAAGCVKAGNDIVMPGGKSDFEDIMKALSDEEHPYHLTREELEVCAGRVLSYLKKLQNV